MHFIHLLVLQSSESKQIFRSSSNHLVQDVDKAWKQPKTKCVQ